jgi:hypothetical protein
MALVCAAMLSLTASGFSMHKAGWFTSRAPRQAEIPQVSQDDSGISEAAMRYRTNQTTNWRAVMSVR